LPSSAWLVAAGLIAVGLVEADLVAAGLLCSPDFFTVFTMRFGAMVKS
jgi:hypothetical protein